MNDALRKRVRVGLALSGGGGRGLAQVGVFKVFEREGVPIDLIAGSSIGSIIGGLYACWPDAEALETRVLEFVTSRYMQGLNLETIRKLGGVPPVDDFEAKRTEPGFFGKVQSAIRRLYASHLALSRLSVLKGDAVRRTLDALFEDRTFDQTEIPFAAIAVDLDSASEVILSSGPVALAVSASSAIPGIFPPVEIEGRLLIDGGYTSPVPIDAIETMGANVVVAVDVSQSGIPVEELVNGVEVAMRASEISLIALEKEQLRRADVCVPARGMSRHWSDFSHPEEAIEAGEEAAEKMLSSIFAAVEERARLFL